MESNAKTLAEVNSKQVEQEQNNLSGKESNDMTENNQALTDAKCEIEKLEKEKSELQIESNLNLTKIKDMKEAHAKDRKFKQKLAIKVFNFHPNLEDLESLLKLDLEELYSKSNEDKGGLITESISIFFFF